MEVNINNMVTVEFCENIGEKTYERVAIYNKNFLNKAQAEKLIKKNKKNKYMFVIDKAQYEGVFNGK